MKFTFLLTTLLLLGVVHKNNAQIDCTFIGNQSGTYNTGNYNTGFGAYSLNLNTGFSNNAFGVLALNNSNGGFNCAFGNESLKNNTTGELNAAFGTRTMENNTIGYRNIAIGHRALGNNVTGSINTAVGYGALSSVEGFGNIALGYYTPRNLQSGSYNTFIGTETAVNLVNGSYNVFLGKVAVAPIPTDQIIVGNDANNTIIFADGRGSQRMSISEYGNVAIGLGNNVKATNKMDIGGGIVIGKNYSSKAFPTPTLGAIAPNNGLLVEGSVGIGNTLPKNKVEITHGVNGNSGLRFTNLTSDYIPTTTQTSNKFLTVNALGDVVLQNMPGGTGSSTIDTNVLNSSGNLMTSNVNNIVDTAPIVNSISNTITSSNQLITTVNGVASQPVDLPVSGSGSGDISQVLSQVGNTITLSNGGGSFTLPTLTDTDHQSLALSGNTLSISNGNSVVLPIQPPQTLSQSGNTVTLSNGGGSFTLPTFVNTDAQSLTLTGNTLSISNGNTVTIPTTSVVAGNNVTVTGNGTTASPYLIAAADTSLYANNGTINSATTTSGNRVVTMNNNNIWFKSSAGDANGKLYIGNTATYPTTTGNYKLFVEGGIMTEKVKVALRSTANWADYVFEENYKLMPLKEVAKFVGANKHLPGINSAANLFENGLDVAEMQSKQMEKIEELTLYIIDQDKKIEAQNNAIDRNNKEIEELKLQVKALIEKTK